MKSRLARPAHILLVEDNEDDVELTRQSLLRSKLDVNLHHVGNGEQCMDYLRRRGDYSAVSTPDLILLDLNMPVMDGREVLAELQTDDRLSAIPVVVLTTSSDPRDIAETYRLRCNSYVTKPVDFKEFQKKITEIYEYWFSVVALPQA